MGRSEDLFVLFGFTGPSLALQSCFCLLGRGGGFLFSELQEPYNPKQAETVSKAFRLDDLGFIELLSPKT